MPDVTREEFLAGLQVLYSFDYGTASLVGPDRVAIGVIDDAPPGVTVQQAASWIVEACHRAARRCETCRHCKQWTTSDGEPRAACTRLSDAHKVIEFVVPERDGCSRWQDKEAADA